MVWATLHKHQIEVFVITFMCVMSLHAARESWYMVKHEVHETLGFSSTFLGTIDTVFLLFYSLGYYSSGILGDRFVVTKMVGYGMLCAAVLYVIICVLCMLRVVSHPVYLILWALQGPSQGTDLTGCVAIMANWFPPEIRGRVMGLWGANQSVGNIVGEYMAAVIYDQAHLSWEWVIAVPALLVAIVAVCLLVFVYDHPKAREAAEVTPNSAPLIVRDVSAHAETIADYEHEDHKPHVGFWESWQLPGVALCAFSYGGVKLLNYGMRMWMPYYLIANFHMHMGHLALLLSTYNIGGIAGSVLGGWLSDAYSRRMATVGSMLLLSIPLMILFRMVTPSTEFLFYVFIPLMGVMIGGVANLMSCAVSADLAQQQGAHAHQDAKTTVIGIINGTGSFGAAFGQVMIGWLQTYSWNYVFAFLVGKRHLAIALFSFSMLVPLIMREGKKSQVAEIDS